MNVLTYNKFLKYLIYYFIFTALHQPDLPATGKCIARLFMLNHSLPLVVGVIFASQQVRDKLQRKSSLFG